MHEQCTEILPFIFASIVDSVVSRDKFNSRSSPCPAKLLLPLIDIKKIRCWCVLEHSSFAELSVNRDGGAPREGARFESRRTEQRRQGKCFRYDKRGRSTKERGGRETDHKNKKKKGESC